jgi:hypothetical protein
MRFPDRMFYLDWGEFPESPLKVLPSARKNNKGIGDFVFLNPKLSDFGKSDSPASPIGTICG